jgi:superfamily II DNA/RNA helicase
VALAYEPSPFDPAPIPFDKLSLDVRLLGGIRDLGWSDTRPIQSGVIPLAQKREPGRPPRFSYRSCSAS